MAFGSKLGKVFGAIGKGLSFVPGPFGAVGMALSAAGGIAEAVGQRQDQEGVDPAELARASQPQAAPDMSRPGQAQLPQPAQPHLTLPGGQSVRPGPQGVNTGNYQQQFNMDLARMLLRDDPGGLDG